MITEQHAAAALATLAAYGLKVPDSHTAPADRATGTPPGRVVAARLYAAALTHAGMLPGELDLAVLEYVNEPDAGQYPKAFPSPGHLIARSPMGRVQMHLGTDADADAALSDFSRRMSALVSRGGPSMADRNQHLDADPHRNAAMFAALDAVGGARAWGEKPADDRTAPHRWRVAYMDERKRQAQSPRAVRLMVVSVARQIGVAS